MWPVIGFFHRLPLCASGRALVLRIEPALRLSRPFGLPIPDAYAAWWPLRTAFAARLQPGAGRFRARKWPLSPGDFFASLRPPSGRNLWRASAPLWVLRP